MNLKRSRQAHNRAAGNVNGPVSVGPEVTAAPLTLSVLDLVPVRSDQTSGDALAAAVALIRTAEDAGYHRYWLAENHNMPAFAATNPPVLIELLA